MNKKPKTESIQLEKETSFRFLQWNSMDVTDVEVIGPDSKTYRFKGSGDTWHCHPGMELVLITQGAGTRLVGDNISAFKALDLVLLGPNLPHYWHTEHPISGCALQFDFGPEHAFWSFPETKGIALLWQKAQKGIHYTGKIADDIAKLILPLSEGDDFGRLTRFMMLLSRLHQAPESQWSFLSDKAFPTSQEQDTYRGIQKAIHVLLNTYHEDLKLADVLRVSGMSKSTFERQFKQRTGKTFSRFLAEVRIDAVRRLLVETDDSIGEIVFASGFNSLSHFNHQFVKIQGESPSTFRRKVRLAGS